MNADLSRRMKDPGAQAALRAGLILLGAAVLRVALTPGAGSPVLNERTDVADSLLSVGDSLARDSERRSRPLAAGERLDPNTAGEAELDRLPRVGPAIAARIVADRTANGPYRRPDDLLRVPGLGPGSVERLSPLLDFSGAGDLPRPVEAKEGTEVRRLLGVVDRSREPEESGLVRLNHASAVQLESLPGIGPVLARRIIEIRRARGGFRSLEDLLDVSGVGPAVLSRLRPMVTLR